MENRIVVQLSRLFRARFPYIYITTWEEERAISLIKKISKSEKLIRVAREVYVWTQTNGFVVDGQKIDGTQSPDKAIDFIRDCNKNSVFVMCDFHVFFGVKGRQVDYNVVRRLRDNLSDLKTSKFRKNVIFLASELLIPETMQKEITILDMPLPTLSEIKAKFDKMITQNTQIDTSGLDEEGKEKLCKAAMGLTLQEAENAFALAMVNDGKVDVSDLDIILSEKMQVIKKTGILEFINTDIKISDVGGLENLKSWLNKRNNSWSESAKKYCLPAPKGVLITGVPGCGKSLTAKAMSAAWQLPLLKLDFGKIFSGIVGSSEENMRKAIKTAEAVAPSILWVDEIEKSLSGLNSNGDSGTSSRIFGTFLTWMQEKTAPVFVIATANNINSLPAELLRKGRFDEIFFVDLPTQREREEIFKLHLSKRLKDKDVASKIEINSDLYKQLAQMTEGFVGAEIEQVVISALYEAFFNKRPLEFSDLANTIKNVVPLSVTQKEQILAIRQWANIRAVAATKKDDMVEYSSKADSEDDVNSSRGGRALDV
ncbi:MAG: AAA family ATPase [Candidatus Gastranaerophilaceae bacterium]|jgi:ATP-dependent 26S proteasome regulatory subunit|nr:aTPase AAA family [Fusobacterium sp. CAG:815]DAA91177.1 MAG TPA: ATPase [Candidatus Gastranaerophilales bacterium HUM_6]DAA93046.1 MAG TPA: ATPase [Candidatus Gastranaerophilales bacterium HUM_7]DAB04268.1 MAG TPA: ATPase [Candidatus Gastranaerophilales bacterium HUM_12]DAB06127.1 MAG TPA: ATPase [Candidatus Gastranaerophilales bacterium HUM_14]